MFDVVVIGSGVVGAMVSRKLSQYDVSVCLLEKGNDIAIGASMANSGIIHAGFDAVPGTLKAKLNVKGSEMMEQIASELNVKYRNNGAIVVGYNEEDLSVLKELYNRGIENGVKSLKILNQAEVRSLEENISDDVTCALYAPTSSIICPYSLAIAAIGNAMDNGVTLKLNFEVTSVTYDDGIYTISSDKDSVRARYVINAAGLFADKIAGMVGDNSFNIHPRKGEYILLDRECGELVNCTVFKTPTKMGKGILVSPTAHGNLLLGPTSANIEDKDSRDTSQEGFDLIIKQARDRVKNVPFGKTITSFCGLRAVGDTEDFIIKMSAPCFVTLAGIESPGLSASPAIAEHVASMLEENGLSLKEKSNYNPNRKAVAHFAHLSTEEKNRIIKEDPSYGKIVCRCESVTKGEILDALRMNPRPRDLDGIKRRTRASMGRCQGGFCYPYLIEILADELQIPYEKVTKFGADSVINVGKTKEGVSYEKR